MYDTDPNSMALQILTDPDRGAVSDPDAWHRALIVAACGRGVIEERALPTWATAYALQFDS